ncbi:MAG: hypothetical protein J7598_02170 [Mitsuaria chitosanitabida]|uniref:hypothetical protein n=1 Tax=Roseateles chitosanitabidus TaxID=65048 RepID=UPI001B173275|nr:hypothetical protein [Roseateles chitosanitabidus]MBO9685394.1 hypothetical protein [Roseateles chitosanitabidus]
MKAFNEILRPTWDAIGIVATTVVGLGLLEVLPDWNPGHSRWLHAFGGVLLLLALTQAARLASSLRR